MSYKDKDPRDMPLNTLFVYSSPFEELVSYFRQLLEQFVDGENSNLLNTDNAHRRAAHAQFEASLEKGVLTPDEVDKLKSLWDKRNGF